MSDAIQMFLSKLAERRKQLDLSVAELSYLSGVRKSTITKYEEEGFTSIPLDQFERLLSVLGFTFDEFEKFVEDSRVSVFN